jgi:acetyltransferase-like isoleucine patch superfamily enzyme
VGTPQVDGNSARRASTSTARHIGRDVVMTSPVVLYGTAKVEAACTLGKYTYVGNGSHVANADIGNYCAIARSVEIGAKPHPTHMLSIHPFQYERTHFVGQPGYDLPVAGWRTVSPATRVRIGHDVWIGAKAVIQHSVEVGTGAVIGSNAVVTKDVPPYAIVGGVPARIIRYRFGEEMRPRLLASRWWLLDPADMREIDFEDVPAAVAEVERRRQMWAGQVREALTRTRSNEADLTNQGVLWFDVPKSYAVPEVIEEFTHIRVERSEPGSIPVGTYPISEGWFDPVSNSFGVWTGEYVGPVPEGSVHFRLS